MTATLAVVLLAIMCMGGCRNRVNWRGRLVVLDMDDANELGGSVVVQY